MITKEVVLPAPFSSGLATAASFHGGVLRVGVSAAGEHAVFLVSGGHGADRLDEVARVEVPAPAIAVDELAGTLVVLTDACELRMIEATGVRVVAPPTALAALVGGRGSDGARSVFDLPFASCLGLHDGGPAAWVLVSGELWRGTAHGWEPLGRIDLHGRVTIAKGAETLFVMGLRTEKGRARLRIAHWTKKGANEHPVRGLYLGTKEAVTIRDYAARVFVDEHGQLFAAIELFGNTVLAVHESKGHFAMSSSSWPRAFERATFVFDGMFRVVRPGGPAKTLRLDSIPSPFDARPPQPVPRATARPIKIAPRGPTDPTLLSRSARFAETGAFLADGSVVIASLGDDELVVHRFVEEESVWRESRFATPAPSSGFLPEVGLTAAGADAMLTVGGARKMLRPATGEWSDPGTIEPAGSVIGTDGGRVVRAAGARRRCVDPSGAPIESYELAVGSRRVVALDRVERRLFVWDLADERREPHHVLPVPSEALTGADRDAVVAAPDDTVWLAGRVLYRLAPERLVVERAFPVEWREDSQLGFVGHLVAILSQKEIVLHRASGEPLQRFVVDHRRKGWRFMIASPDGKAFLAFYEDGFELLRQGIDGTFAVANRAHDERTPSERFEAMYPGFLGDRPKPRIVRWPLGAAIHQALTDEKLAPAFSARTFASLYPLRKLDTARSALIRPAADYVRYAAERSPHLGSLRRLVSDLWDPSPLQAELYPQFDGEDDTFAIDDLRGIELCVGLEEVILQLAPRGVDLSPLTKLPNLRALTLYGPHDNAESLARCPKLETLTLSASRPLPSSLADSLTARGVKIAYVERE